jgi:ubiquinone biosynthesis protein
MMEQIGWEGLVARVKIEARQWSNLLPQLPRLAHAALAAQARPNGRTASQTRLDQLTQSHRRVERRLIALALLVLVLTALHLVPWIPGLAVR